MNLQDLGWDSAFAEPFEPHAAQGLCPGRVAAAHRRLYRLYTEHGELLAEVSGRFRHAARGESDFPVTGDWVAAAPRPGEGRATIHGVLPRRSRFSRKTAGIRTEEQVLAANVDTAFLVMGLDGDFNPRRLERYLVQAWESGAEAVVVLNKSDLCEDLAARLRETRALVAGVPVLAVSGLTSTGLDALDPYLRRGRTAVLLGSSGVGKSTLINRLARRDVARTGLVRPWDDRGRHTTTHRELIPLPRGGLIIDTPGMRELALWAGEEGLGQAFDDVEALAAACGFRDCRHLEEPRCAVKQALADGTLPAGRLDSYRKLEAERRRLATRRDQRAQLEEKRKWRSIHRLARDFRPRG